MVTLQSGEKVPKTVGGVEEFAREEADSLLSPQTLLHLSAGSIQRDPQEAEWGWSEEGESAPSRRPTPTHDLNETKVCKTNNRPLRNQKNKESESQGTVT